MSELSTEECFRVINLVMRLFKPTELEIRLAWDALKTLESRMPPRKEST